MQLVDTLKRKLSNKPKKENIFKNNSVISKTSSFGSEFYNYREIEDGIIDMYTIPINKNIENINDLCINCYLCPNTVDSELFFTKCKHVYHIDCLAKYQIENINQEFKCLICEDYISENDLLYIHTSFSENMKKKIIEKQLKLDSIKEIIFKRKKQYKLQLNIIEDFEKYYKSSNRLLSLF